MRSGSKQRIKFEIRDTGIGMTPEQVARIFSPFVQADASTTRHYGGTGLGLTICKRLVEAMGGGIEVESQPQVGSRFYFTLLLPVSRFPQQTPQHSLGLAASSPDGSGAAHRGLKILLVDDAPENRLLIVAYLKRFPDQLIQAEHGAEALELFKSQPFDLVLMDMLMPVMDGYDATAAIRAYERQSGSGPVPIIALTAQALKADLTRALEAGCDLTLTKPVRKLHLLEAINRFRG